MNLAKQEVALKQQFDASKGQLMSILPRMLPAQKLWSVLLNTFRTNPRLQGCTPESVIGSVIRIYELGLDLSIPNEASLQPYKSECKAGIGYKGLIKLSRRSGTLLDVGARAVREKDEFHRSFGTEGDYVRHSPPPISEDRGQIVGFYSYLKLKSGETHVEEMSLKEMHDHRDRYVRFKEGPWFDPAMFEQMGNKTVLRKVLWRWADMDVQLAEAIRQDIEEEEYTEDYLEDVDKRQAEAVPAEATSPPPALKPARQSANGKRKLIDTFIQSKKWEPASVQVLIKEFTGNAADDLDQLQEHELTGFLDYIKKI